jgi:hypothetical protein
MKEKEISKKTITWWYAAGEFIEILSAGALAVALTKWAWFWSALATALALFVIAMLVRARANSLEARGRKQIDSGYHVITDARLKTLKTVDVGEDIRDVLAELKPRGSIQATVIAEHLENNLGTTRMREKLEVILRYTRTSAPPPPQTAT